MKPKKQAEKTVRCTSRRIAEHVRMEMLRARRIANAGHEVGDTSTDPIVVEEEPVQSTELAEGEQKPGDPDRDYVLFLLKGS
nr:proline-rich receptor-like protein kinase PERK8 [Ipomoea batatas]